MRARGDLRLLQQVALSRLARLRSVLTFASTSAISLERDRAVSYCVIELHSFWYAFSRSMFLSCAFEAVDGTGTRISLNVAVPLTTDDALTLAIRRVKPGVAKTGKPPWTWRDEPNWTRTSALLDALDEIGASNRGTVAAGLAQGGSAFDHLVPFRNFFAHRGEATRLELAGITRIYAISPSLRATDALLTKASGPGGQRPQPLLNDLLDQVTNAVATVV